MKFCRKNGGIYCRRQVVCVQVCGGRARKACFVGMDGIQSAPYKPVNRLIRVPLGKFGIKKGNSSPNLMVDFSRTSNACHECHAHEVEVVGKDQGCDSLLSSFENVGLDCNELARKACFVGMDGIQSAPYKPVNRLIRVPLGKFGIKKGNSSPNLMVDFSRTSNACHECHAHEVEVVGKDQGCDSLLSSFENVGLDCNELHLSLCPDNRITRLVFYVQSIG